MNQAQNNNYNKNIILAYENQHKSILNYQLVFYITYKEAHRNLCVFILLKFFAEILYIIIREQKILITYQSKE